MMLIDRARAFEWIRVPRNKRLFLQGLMQVLGFSSTSREDWLELRKGSVRFKPLSVLRSLWP